MTCSRCGAEAAVKRESALYCGKCAMARDWEEIIAIVQSERVGGGTVSFDAAEAEAPVGDGQEPASVASGSASNADELPADPFG